MDDKPEWGWTLGIGSPLDVSAESDKEYRQCSSAVFRRQSSVGVALCCLWGVGAELVEATREGRCAALTCLTAVPC
jgi:hypothetical protein